MAKNLRTNTTINKDSGTHFEKVVKEWRDTHRSNWKNASSRIEKLLRVSIDGFADFIAASEFDNSTLCSRFLRGAIAELFSHTNSARIRIPARCFKKWTTI